MQDRPTILIADDELHILHVLALKLSHADYNVITARDGNEALELTRKERPDLIITDYQMPGLTGLELCHALKSTPETQAIPSILLTARGFSLRLEEMEQVDIRLCIHKPFGPKQILQAVQELLKEDPVYF